MKNKKQSGNISFKDHIAGKIATRIVNGQLWLTKRLSRLEGKLSTRAKKLLFLLFVACSGGYCALLLVSGMTGSYKDQYPIERPPVSPLDTISYRRLNPPVPADFQDQGNKHKK